MAQPWTTLDRVSTPDGILELRRRGTRDFLITIEGRVLMNSSASRSEITLGDRACRPLTLLPKPRVLIGGLGMGLTLRASLDALPALAAVVIAELNPAMVAWCRGPLASVSGNAVDDPRVRLELADAARVITEAARPGADKYDAVILDLYEGPHAATDEQNDPFYGRRALNRTAMALSTGGIFAVWGESPDHGFEKRLAASGFSIERLRPGRGGLRHVVYIARKQ